MSGPTALKSLDKLQLGHIRHFNNLSRQLPNQWELMKGKGYGQEDFGGFRFQLAYMAFALALTHKHRLPAAPGLFKPIFERLIEKMLLPEVWIAMSAAAEASLMPISRTIIAKNGIQSAAITSCTAPTCNRWRYCIITSLTTIAMRSPVR